MKKRNFSSRALSMFLAVVMVLSMVPWMQLNIFAAIGDLKKASDYTYSDFDYNDTINLPIKIFDYSNDGMLFEYLLGHDPYSSEDPGTYQYESPYHIDYTKEYSNFATGKLNNIFYGGNNSAYFTKTHEAAVSNGARWANLVNALDRRTLYNVGKFLDDEGNANADKSPVVYTDIDSIRYFVIAYRSTTSLASPGFGISTTTYTHSDGKAAAYETSGKFSGFYNFTAGTGKWEYGIIDLKGKYDESTGKYSGISSDVRNLYLVLPMTKKGEQIDISCFGFFDNYGDAEQYGQYGVTIGSTRTDPTTYNNKGFGLLTENSAFGNADTWIGNRLSKFGSDQNVHFLYMEGTNSSTGGEYLKYWDGSYELNGTTYNEDIGYDLRMTFEELATVGLLKSTLSSDGIPIYKKSVVMYLASYLQNRKNLGRYDSNGWQNYDYVTGSSEWFSKDLDGDGQLDANERRGLFEAICELCSDDYFGINSSNNLDKTNVDSATATNITAYYNNSIKKFNNGQLRGDWFKCKDNIKCWTDAAVYLLHNLFVPDSYNQTQDAYRYFVMPSALDTTTGERTYLFDAGFTRRKDPTNDNATVNDTYSALVYNQNGTISLADVDSKYMIQYDSRGNYTTRFPFLPIHTVSGDAGKQNETDSPYFTEVAVSSTATYGETYENRNYNYTLTSQGNFVFFKDQDYYFNFEGDDDVYLFINGELVLDLGATHGISRAKININDYVEWAQENLESSNATDKARAQKLNLVDGESYRFDFFYMERHGTGANLKISTNIPVTDPAMGPDKKAYQNGVEIPNAGVADSHQLVEYSFAITNDTDAKLYNFEFIDSTIGVALRYYSDENVAVFEPGKALNAEGSPLKVTDLVAYIDGYNADGDTIPTVVVTFKDELELKDFLCNLAAKGTQGDDGTTTGQSGAGLWEGSTLTIRGIYVDLNTVQENGRFTNTLNVKAHSSFGIQFLGEDTHRVYTSCEPAFYHWAGTRLNISKDDIIEGVLNSYMYSIEQKKSLFEAGNAKLSLCREDGTSYSYDKVGIYGGGNYINVYYTTPGARLFFVKIRDELGEAEPIIVPVTVYSVNPDDDVLVLDYGLSSILSDSTSLTDDMGLQTSGPDTKITIMGYQEALNPPAFLRIPSFDYMAPIKPTTASSAYSGGLFQAALYKLDDPVTLEWEKPWAIEFKGKFNSGVILLSQTEAANTNGNTYIHINSNCIFLGYRDSYYYNSGVSWEQIGTLISGFDYTAYHTYRLVNRPNVHGTSNMVYLYVDGVDVGPMNQDCRRGNDSYAGVIDISKRDFVFNYVGSSSNNLGLTNCDLNYLKVWADGDLATSNRWHQSEDGHLISVAIDDNVYNDTTLAYDGDKSAATTIKKDSYSLDKTVALYHDKEWSIRWRGNITAGVLLFASGHHSETQDMPYLYIPVESKILLGYYDATDANTNANDYVNYGIQASVGSTKSGRHAFRLVNRINADGSNTIHLYMDGVYVGPLNNAYSGADSLNKKSDWLSGKDLFFNYIGAQKNFLLSGSLDYIEVETGCEEKGPDLYLENCKTDKAGYLLNMLATDINNNRVGISNVGDSAQTTFDDTANGNGTFTVDEHGQLFFKPNTMHGWSNSLYLVMTVHKTGFTPSPVGPSGDEYRIDIANEVQVFKKVTVIPANVVYYEDDFPAITYIQNSDNTNTFTMLGNGSVNLNQSSNQDENYGSDHTYDQSGAEMSGDSTHKVKIDKHGPLACFEFTGTGFELISRTNALDSGSVYLKVFTGSVTVNSGVVNTSNATLTATLPIITQFDNYDDLGDEGIYQVPIIRWSSNSETQEKYTVVVYGVPGYDYAEDGTSTLRNTCLYLDGIRVFQPLGAGNSNYSPVESGASFIEIRNEVINGFIGAAEFDGTKVTVSTSTTSWSENHTGANFDKTIYEGNEVAGVNDYLVMGPNNEVYMDGTFTSSALVFYVAEKGAIHNLQIAVRAIDYGEFIGAGKTFENIQLQYGVKIGNTYGWMPLANTNSSTEQYFTIPYTECPVTSDGYYQIAIRVAPVKDYIPAFASFTSLKMNGLDLKKMDGNGEIATLTYVNGVLTNVDSGAEVCEGDDIIVYPEFNMVSYQMSSDRVFSAYESERDEDFVVEQPDENVPAIIPVGPSLSFDGEIIYNVYFMLQNVSGVTTDEMGLITFDSALKDGGIEDAADVIPGARYGGGEYMVRTHGIPAKKLGDMLYFKIYVKMADGSYLYSDLLGYSAKLYAHNRLEYSDNPAMKALVVAMLNYGAAAQEYFGYRTDALMNADLTAEQKSLVLDYSDSMIDDLTSVDSQKAGQFVSTGDGFLNYSASVSFNGDFSINYYMRPAFAAEDMTFYYWNKNDFDSVEILTEENASGCVSMEALSNGEYMSSYTGIAAKEIDEPIYVAAVYTCDGVTYSSGVLVYSLGAYCRWCVANSGEKMQSLAASTAVYGYYAEAYFAN